MPPTLTYDPKEFEAAVDYVTRMNPYVESREDAVECLRGLIESGTKRGRHWIRCGGFVLTFTHRSDTEVDVGIYVQALFHGRPSREKLERRTAWDRLAQEDDES